jgi:anti-sigma regulatory factor (Ser/Thr protein kinase)
MHSHRTARTNGTSASEEGRGATRRDDHDAIELRFALDAHAPGAARDALADGLGTKVPTSVLDDARLLVTELVTNSVCHSGAADDEDVVVRFDLTVGTLRLEVEDPGHDAVIAPRAANLETGGGFGLALVQSLSERWGVERAAGGTRVWAELAPAADRGVSL